MNAKGLFSDKWRRRRIRVLLCMFAAAVTVLVVVLLTAPGLPRDWGPLPTLGGMTSASRIEPLYSRVAGQLMGRKVEVRCWSNADWARLSHEASAYTQGRFKLGPWSGYTDDKHKLVNLPPRVCQRLGLLAYRRLVPEDGRRRLLAVLVALGADRERRAHRR